MPAGRYCTARTSVSAPGPHVVRAGCRGVMSTNRDVGREAEHDGLADADELVGEPVVGEEGDDRRVGGLGHAATLRSPGRTG